MAQVTLDEFIARWSASAAAERANKDLFLTELCDTLGVARPDPATGDTERDHYVFEKGALLLKDGQRTTTGHVDLYKAGCFVLEAKQGSHDGTTRIGTARRGTGAWSNAMQEAYGQALQYARTLDDPPPFVIVCDIGYCFDLYATFDGSLDYRPFPDPRTSRIFLADLATHHDLLHKIFQDPKQLDPSKHAAKVTREIAGHIAELARGLEADGHAPELIARFLMRCLFTMFAEDARLLPDRVFTNELEKQWIKDPSRFPAGCESLWRAMEAGNDFGYFGKLLRFNGGLFQDPVALPLTRQELERLLEAARASWIAVEPAIFGTLLERALDPRERHRLGAHYTPRAYVERLVKPTIEDPVRAEWDNVRTQVHHLVAQGKVDDAQEAVKEFLRHLCSIRVLDPACGTGNFLYVTLDLFKRLEGEVVKLLLDLPGTHEPLVMMQGSTVTPAQFLGIEVKPWAREIANLVLWIGYLQWQLRARGDASHFPEPVLQEYGNIECRDAVLAWDRIETVLDDAGKPVTRWDGVTTKSSPVTGEKIPDDAARVPVVRFVNPRKTEWPPADYVVGNPPFIGNWRMRTALGDGYVEALRSVHRNVPDSCDYVMYWWDTAAALTRAGRLRRFGLITTNSISQSFNRRVVQSHLGAIPPLSIHHAIPDHPWVDSTDGAAVRIAMTVCTTGIQVGLLSTVTHEAAGPADEVIIELTGRMGVINADLTIGANVAAAVPLLSNVALSSPGVKLHGAGFIVTPDEAEGLGRSRIEGLDEYIVPYRHGRDLTSVSRGLSVIDLHGLDIDEVQRRFPEVFQWLVERVKPEREHNNEEYRRKYWWLFGRKNTELRAAVLGLGRYISTPETAKHRFFVFLDGDIRPDNMLINIGLDDALFLGVLSSHIHVVWALAAGGRLGVGNDPRYNKTRCFDPFPFPDGAGVQAAHIRELGESLDAHRKRQQALYPTLTITALYNVLQKLRSGEALTTKDKLIHEQGLVSVLKQIHNNLDAAVFDAYGWPTGLTNEQILERLVALNFERAEEERNGLVRWLRPEFQNPQGEKEGQRILVAAGGKKAVKEKATKARPSAWPKDLPSRIAAVRATIESHRHPVSVEDVAKAFKKASRAEVASILESLSRLGLARSVRDGNTVRWSAVRIA